MQSLKYEIWVQNNGCYGNVKPQEKEIDKLIVL